MDSVTQYLNDIRQIPRLSPEEEIELSKRVAAGDPQAKEKFITSNLRLVVKIANTHYQQNGILIEDLVQAGNLGLMRAVDSFDPTVGTRFSTHAYPKIKRAITFYIESTHSPIRIPGEKQDTLKKLKRAIEDLSKQMGREPTDEELANFLEISPEIVTEIKQYLVFSQTFSLDAPITNQESDNITIGDDIASPKNEIETLIGVSYVMDIINKANLTDMQKDALIKVYGLDGNEPMSEEVYAKIYGVTRQAISDRITKAKSKVASYLSQAGFTINLASGTIEPPAIIQELPKKTKERKKIPKKNIKTTTRIID